MMFIIRGTGERPEATTVEVKLSRATPAIVAEAAGTTDFFCVGDANAMAALRASRWSIVELHDGYYEDGRGGGIGIWGQGKFWEIRDTPFTIKEAVEPSAPSDAGPARGEEVNVRGSIFGI